MDANNHKSCETYFGNLNQVVAEIMQKVYGELESHNRAFIDSGYVNIWDEKLAELAEGRWIDTIFGISALMSISTQLSFAKSSGSLCVEHGVPVIKLAEATSINIASSMIKDSQIHLHSLLRLEKSLVLSNPGALKSHEIKNKQLQIYFDLISSARRIVLKHSNSHSVEMVFSQFSFNSKIEDLWIGKVVA